VFVSRFIHKLVQCVVYIENNRPYVNHIHIDPISCLYMMGSTKSHPIFESCSFFKFLIMGVVIDFHSIIPNLFNISTVYFPCWVAKVPSFYQPFTSLSIHFHFTFNHISLSHTLTLNHFHDYMGFRHIIFQCIYFSVFE
jgi:hypothetical protein